MLACLGIREENGYPNERRAPLTPQQVKTLIDQHQVRVIVEPSEKRVFKDQEYNQAGARVSKDLSGCNVILGIKEIPPENLIPNQNYIFFSHTTGGHPSNMPMLKRILELKSTLIDYELMKNETGRRLIFFGRYAGYAGMIDSLWALGQRLHWEGMDNPFKEIKKAYEYNSLKEAQEEIKLIGKRILKEGLPNLMVPFFTAFLGQGNVSKGAQRIFQLLPTVRMLPEDLPSFFASGRFSNGVCYIVEFRQINLYEPKNLEMLYDYNDLHRHPEQYVNRFEKYVPYFNMIINGINWDPQFPRIITKSYLRSFYLFNPHPRLRVIGDITCDVEGSIEPTVKTTDSSNPTYVYEPLTDRVIDGWKGIGPVIMAVDTLPSELPREASEAFGTVLMRYAPTLARTKYQVPFEELNLASEIKRAVIVHRGSLTKRFQYLESKVH